MAGGGGAARRLRGIDRRRRGACTPSADIVQREPGRRRHRSVEASGRACPTASRWSAPTASASAPANARWSPGHRARASRPCSAPLPASGRLRPAPIKVPAKATLMMLPQRPYFPVGSLHAAIAYPAEAGAFSAERMREVVTAVGLPALAARLDEDAHWNRMLSLGEQQRLGIARALLHAPQYLFWTRRPRRSTSRRRPRSTGWSSRRCRRPPSCRSGTAARSRPSISATSGWCAPATGSSCRTARRPLRRQAGLSQRRGHGRPRIQRCQTSANAASSTRRPAPARSGTTTAGC